MRLLLALPSLYTDTSVGAARSLRTLLRWRTEAGHACEVLCTARTETETPLDIEAHLRGLSVAMQRTPAPTRAVRSGSLAYEQVTGAATARFVLGGIPVTLLLTRHNARARPDQAESAQFAALFDGLLTRFRPDAVLTQGNHFVAVEVMKRARKAGVATMYSLRTTGYEKREWFAHADSVLVTSPWLARHYAGAIGLRSTGIVSPIEWSEVVAPEESRAFVTFVNPAPHKGLALFARLAAMLCARRPDIPVLIVQSATEADALNHIPGLDFSNCPQIMAAPPVPRPADFFALTKILLVPSVGVEAFGRVAAEALVNGVPPLVSDRGGLPETVQEGGIVLPLPEWMQVGSPRLPTEDEARPWFDAVCRLWDDPDAYARASRAARETGRRLYSEDALKAQYAACFENLRPGGRVLP